MRRAVVAGILLLMVTPVAARTRVHVPPFTVARGDEQLGYFGPEVARAISDVLEAAGIEAGAGGEVTVSGRIEELTAERVRLTATVRNRSVSAEGPLENIDAVAAQLAQRVQLLVEPTAPPVLEAAHQKAVPHPAAPAHAAAPAVAHVATPPEHKPPAVAAPAPAPVVAAPAPAATPKEPAKDSAPAVASPAPSPSPAAHAEAEEKPAPPSPPPSPRPTRREDPYEYLPATSPPPPSYPSYPAPGWVRGRVVAHAIAEVPNAFAGTGASATQALFTFLRRRMGLSIVPTGYGLAPPQIAADEAWRSAARAVVMARVSGVEYRAHPAGQSVSCRLEVMVVRDGRTVLRRIVDAGPTDPGLRRGRYYEDPIAQAVSAALESILPELTSAVQ